VVYLKPKVEEEEEPPETTQPPETEEPEDGCLGTILLAGMLAAGAAVVYKRRN
jgi:hypothetical protein